MNPHLLAPGGSVYTRTMTDLATVSSGTSMSAAYMSGLLALWLQFKRQQNVTWQPADVSQAAALADLMLTSNPVLDQSSWEAYYEPVARAGAGEGVHSTVSTLLRFWLLLMRRDLFIFWVWFKVAVTSSRRLNTTESQHVGSKTIWLQNNPLQQAVGRSGLVAVHAFSANIILGMFLQLLWLLALPMHILCEGQCKQALMLSHS